MDEFLKENIFTLELRHEKTCSMHMGKERRRSERFCIYKLTRKRNASSMVSLYQLNFDINLCTAIQNCTYGKSKHESYCIIKIANFDAGYILNGL